MPETIIALEQDLFFAVKIRDTLHHHAYSVVIARNITAFEQAIADAETPPALAIVNISTPRIDWEAAIRSANAHGVPVLAFGAHIDIAAQQRARQAGAQRVVANSKFAQNMPALVRQMLQTTASAYAAEDEIE
jgi:Response regulators consisting of a CheY-like receiver domain and a winged-helix DNA-binding domain